MPTRKIKAIAGSDEVLQYLTAIMRGEEGEGKDRLKAAELIGKGQGLFTDKNGKENVEPVKIVDDIPKRDNDVC